MPAPEYYVDQFQLMSNAFTTTIRFGVGDPPAAGEKSMQSTLREVAMVRMSLGQAKILAMLLRKSLKDHERNNDFSIIIPSKVAHELGLAPDDW